MNKYNHKSYELNLLQKITNVINLVLTLYTSGKISKEVKEILIKELSK